MALEPMQWNWTSSRVDVGYMELFRVASVTSGFIQTCEGVLWDALEFHKGSQSSFPVWCGTRNCSAWNAGDSGLISQRGGSLMVFL